MSTVARALFGEREGEAVLAGRIASPWPTALAVLAADALAPPFRPLSEAEDGRIVGEICQSGARILFVGLGAPKQERWMAAHRGSIPAVMLGVGAAFDFLSGVKPQAPAWMQSSGLEWLFRFSTEPRRLWWRYLKHNPRFAALFAWQLIAHRFTT